MNVYNQIILKNQPMNVSFASPYEQAYEMIGYCVVASITGTPNGIIKLQGSADSITFPGGPQTWFDLPSSYTIGTAGTQSWNVTGAFYNFFRVSYTDLSGGSSTATVTITVNAKSY